MATTLASYLQRNLDLASSSGSRSTSGNASPSSRHASGSIPRINMPTEDSYFGDVVYESPGDSDDPELMLRRLPRRKSADHGLHWNQSENVLVRQGWSDYSGAPSPSPSQSVSSLSSAYTTYDQSTLLYDRIIDTLAAAKPNPFMFTGTRNLYMFDPSTDENLNQESIAPLMIKRLKNSSPETLLLYATHNAPLRDDPWNAVPHIVGVVERGDWVYLCMNQLSEYNDPPFITVEHYIDFFRQVLERLTFMHEHGISGLSLSDPSSYMMDTSSAPPTSSDEAPEKASSVQFNRFKYPVHYYFVNFTKATRAPRQSLFPASSPVTPSYVESSSFAKDIRECGMMFRTLLASIPQVAEIISPFVDLMEQGHFTIKHFETLLGTIDKSLFETTATQTPTPDAKNARPNSEALSGRNEMGKCGSIDRSLSH